MGLSNLVYSPEKLTFLQETEGRKFRASTKVALVMSTSNPRAKNKARPVHVARFDFTHMRWVPLCGTRIDFGSSLTGEMADVSCLRCEPLLGIIEGVSLVEGEYPITDPPFPLM